MIALLLVPGALVALLLLVLHNLLAEEIRGWLELIPVALLRLVAVRVPADQRRELYDQEWLPELLCDLRKAEGRPITRFVVGVKYSICLLPSVRTVARDLRDLSDNQETAANSIPPDSPPAHVLPTLKVLEETGGAGAQLRGEGRVITASANLVASATLSGTGSLRSSASGDLG